MKFHKLSPEKQKAWQRKSHECKLEIKKSICLRFMWSDGRQRFLLPQGEPLAGGNKQSYKVKHQTLSVIKKHLLALTAIAQATSLWNLRFLSNCFLHGPRQHQENRNKVLFWKYHSDDSIMRDKERIHTLPQIMEGGDNETQWTLISPTGKAKWLLLAS